MAPRIKVINPNCTQSMTEALRPVINDLGFGETQYDYFTSPAGPPSINNDQDALSSADVCFPIIKKEVEDGNLYDGYLVACYSVHPLVGRLQGLLGNKQIAVVGIFEASIATSLQYLSIGTDDRFGIVSTGKVWEALLTDGVNNLLVGSKESSSETAMSRRFAGVETTGLNATELHVTSQSVVKAKVIEATRRLVLKPGGRVRAICLGCAGMVGMDSWVREGCTTALGEAEGESVYIIDGVKAGIGLLETMIRLK